MSEAIIPKRSWALYATTAFVLAACLFFISVAAGSLASSWDVCSVISGALVLPIPVFLEVEQYRATFRFNARAARHAGIFLAVISGVLWFGGATNAYEAVMAGWHSNYWWPLGILFGAAVLNTLAAWINFRWGRRLRDADARGALADRRKRFSRRELLLALAAVSITATTVGYAILTTPPQYAEHVTANVAPMSLPKGARDISYARQSRGLNACEFTCEEGAFVEWVESGIGSIESNASGNTVQPITSTYSILRYTALMPRGTMRERMPIENGLYYEWSHEDRGVYAAYDRTTGRGYYYSHSR